jgi:hypothetical protein
LTDGQRARAEAQAARERHRAKVLAETGVTYPERALLGTIQYGITIGPADLPAAAVREYYSLNDPVTEEECRIALAACLTKGWLQVIDEAALTKITDELREGRFLGPIYGLPPIGGVDFTPAGAELWQRLCTRNCPVKSPPFAYTDVVHIKTARFFRTRVAAVAEIEKMKCADNASTVTGPFAIGPWRAQWWRRFSDGYRIDIEERIHWRGRATGQGAGCFLARSPQMADQQRLRHVLDRHNVSLAEWLVLATMEGGGYIASYLPRWAADFAHGQFGVSVSEEDCRKGLDACLDYGWLRIVDLQVMNEIRALLQDDSALLPVSSDVQGRWGEIDFSPDGAALYRMIAAEWLGPNWEDNLFVEKGYYWEEHRYYESEDGLRDVVQEHVDRGEVVRASRVTPIGPWCVYWWERFPIGYRMELEIDVP